MMSRPTITDPLVQKFPTGSNGWYNKINADHFDKAIEHFKKQQEQQDGWPEMPGFRDEPEW